MKEQYERPDDGFLSQAAVLERGWTKTMVVQLLGDPDKTAENSYYKKHPVKLFAKTRVENAEATDLYKSMRKKKDRRAEALRASINLRRKETLAEMQSRIDAENVHPLPVAELLKKAVKSYNKRKNDRACNSNYYYGYDAVRVEPGDIGLLYGRVRKNDNAGAQRSEFLRRIVVNYIRHSMSQYEANMDSPYRRIGAPQAREMAQRAIYGKIGEIYPYLSEECVRQMEYRGIDSGHE